MPQISDNLTVRVLEVRNLNIPTQSTTDVLRHKRKNNFFVRHQRKSRSSSTSDANQTQSPGIYCKISLIGMPGSGIARTKRVCLDLQHSGHSDASSVTSLTGMNSTDVAAADTFKCSFGDHEVHYWDGVSQHSLHGFEVLNLRVKLCSVPFTNKHRSHRNNNKNKNAINNNSNNINMVLNTSTSAAISNTSSSTPSSTAPQRHEQYNNINRRANHKYTDDGDSDTDSDQSSEASSNSRLAHIRTWSWFPTLGKRRKPVVGEVSIRAKEAAILGSSHNLAWYPLRALDAHGNLVQVGEVHLAVYWQSPNIAEFEIHGDGIASGHPAQQHSDFQTRRTTNAATVGSPASLLGVHHHLKRHLSAINPSDTPAQSSSPVANSRRYSHAFSPIDEQVLKSSAWKTEDQESLWDQSLSRRATVSNLRITVISATGLRAADMNNKSDPYFIATCSGKVFKSKTIRRDLNPVWNMECVFTDSSTTTTNLTLQDQINLMVMDKDFGSRDDDLGMLVLPLWKVVALAGSDLTSVAGHNFSFTESFFLHPTTRETARGISFRPGMFGSVKICISFHCSADIALPHKIHIPRSLPSPVNCVEQHTDNNNGNDGNDFRRAHSTGSPSLSVPMDGENANRHRNGLSDTVNSDRGRASSDMGIGHCILGRNKDRNSTHAHLRIRVIQARNLPATDNNGKCDPYVIVKCHSQVFRTPIRKRTLNPRWDCTFDCTRENFNENDMIHLRVKDRDLGFLGDLADEDVGQLSLPLWTIVLDGESSTHPTWYALESSVGANSGEIQVVVWYDGALCKPPALLLDIDKSGENTTSNSRKNKSYTPQEDIYKGKVWHYELQVTVLSAHNLMAMDKSTCTSDPYCVLTCGADKHRTRTISRTTNPVWNQMFKFRQSVDSTTVTESKGLGRQDVLAIELFDYDRGDTDDSLGQVRVELLDIIDRMGYIDLTGAEFVDSFDICASKYMTKNFGRSGKRSRSGGGGGSGRKASMSHLKTPLDNLKGRLGFHRRKSGSRETSFESDMSLNSRQDSFELDSSVGETEKASGSPKLINTKAERGRSEISVAQSNNMNSNTKRCGKIRLKLRLLPIGESRMVKRYKLLARVYNGHNLVTGSSLSTSPQLVYVRIQVGLDVKESDVVPLYRIHKRDGGSISLNQLFLFETEMDWVVDRIRANDVNSARDQMVVMSVCDARNNAVIGGFTETLSNILTAVISADTASNTRMADDQMDGHAATIVHEYNHSKNKPSELLSDECMEATQQHIWLTPSGVSTHDPMTTTNTSHNETIRINSNTDSNNTNSDSVSMSNERHNADLIDTSSSFSSSLGHFMEAVGDNDALHQLLAHDEKVSSQPDKNNAYIVNGSVQLGNGYTPTDNNGSVHRKNDRVSNSDAKLSGGYGCAPMSLEVRFRLAHVQEELTQPTVGHIHICVKSIKYYAHGFDHTLRLVLRYEDRQVPLNTVENNVNASFEKDNQAMFAVHDMYQSVTIELWDRKKTRHRYQGGRVSRTAPVKRVVRRFTDQLKFHKNKKEGEEDNKGTSIRGLDHESIDTLSVASEPNLQREEGSVDSDQDNNNNNNNNGQKDSMNGDTEDGNDIVGGGDDNDEDDDIGANHPSQGSSKIGTSGAQRDSKRGKLVGVCTFTSFELIEHEAHVMYSEPLTLSPMRKPQIKLELLSPKDQDVDKKGTGGEREKRKVKATVWLEAGFVASMGAVVMANPNPRLRPLKPKSVANLRHEAQRLFAVLQWFSVVGGATIALLNWNKPAESLSAMLLISFFCLFDTYTARPLLLPVLVLLAYIVRQHYSRYDGLFVRQFAAQEDLSDLTARLRLAVVKARDLVESNPPIAPSSPNVAIPSRLSLNGMRTRGSNRSLGSMGSTASTAATPPDTEARQSMLPSSFARISIKSASSRDKTPTLAWTRTVPRALTPDFVASRHGFGAKRPTGRAKTRMEQDTKLRDAQLELIQWNGSVSKRNSGKTPRKGGNGSTAGRAIPAFQAQIGNVLAPSQHLVVMVARARGLPMDCNPTVVVSVLHSHHHPANNNNNNWGGSGGIGSGVSGIGSMGIASASAAAASALTTTVVDSTRRGETRKTKTTMCLANEHVWDEQLVLGKRRHIMAQDSIEICIRDEGGPQKRNPVILGRITLALNNIDAQFETSEEWSGSSGRSGHQTVLTGLYDRDCRKARWVTLAGEGTGEILVCAWWVDPVAAAQRSMILRQVNAGYPAVYSHGAAIAGTSFQEGVTQLPQEGNCSIAGASGGGGVSAPSILMQNNNSSIGGLLNFPAADSWKRCLTQVTVDVFDHNGGSEERFLGRAILPVAMLIQNEDHREQAIQDLWLPLTKRFDGARADNQLEDAMYETSRTTCGEVQIRAQVVLPGAQAKQLAMEREQQQRADRAPRRLLAMINTTIEQWQTRLYHINNNAEKFKNLWNWSHPRKTRLLLTLVTCMAVVFAIVPSRYIILFINLFMFTEHFRPMGTMKARFNQLMSLAPTDDDLRVACHGTIAHAKTRFPSDVTDKLAHQQSTQQPSLIRSEEEKLARGGGEQKSRRGTSREEEDTEEIGGTNGTTRIRRSRSASMTSEEMSASGISGRDRSSPTRVAVGKMLGRLTGGSNAGEEEEEAEDALAAAAAGTAADSVTCGSLRILTASGSKLLGQQMHWSRRYFLLTTGGFQWWHERENAEDQHADGNISNIVDVATVSKRANIELRLGCPDHEVMFVVECSSSSNNNRAIRNKNKKPVLVYFAANSIQKRDVWIAALRRRINESNAGLGFGDGVSLSLDVGASGRY